MFETEVIERVFKQIVYFIYILVYTCNIGRYMVILTYD